MFKTIITTIALSIVASSASAIQLSCITHDLSVKITMIDTWIQLTDLQAENDYTFENKGIEEHNGNLFVHLDDNSEGLLIFIDYDQVGFKKGAITFDGGNSSEPMHCNINN